MKRHAIGICLSLVAMCWGCQSGEESAPAEAEVPAAGSAVDAASMGEPPTAPPGQSEMPEPATSKVTLKTLSWDETMALVSQHTGKVVVMDIWATYCPPCIAEFPNLVKLHQSRPGQVSCISLSLDYDGLDETPVETYREKVLAFLEKQGATFENVLCSTDAETVFSEKTEHNSIPIVLVFDQQGKLAGQFPNPKDPAEFTYQENVLPLVEKLLATE